MRKIDVLIVLMLLPMLCGCRLRRPESVLSSKKMEQFLYDYHLAQAVSQDLPQSERYTSRAYIDWAYSKNNISKEQFERSLVWYTRYPKELSKIYKRLSNRIDDEYKAVSRSLSQIEKKSFAVQSGDSVDLWYLDRTALLNTSAYMNKLTYHINKDTTFYAGEPRALRHGADPGRSLRQHPDFPPRIPGAFQLQPRSPPFESPRAGQCPRPASPRRLRR